MRFDEITYVVVLGYNNLDRSEDTLRTRGSGSIVSTQPQIT